MADPLLIFLHIPKTAGSTLAGYFYSAYYEPESPATEDDHLNYGIYHYPLGWDVPVPHDLARTAARPDVRILMGHFAFGIHETLSRPFSYMTLLRDPIDRAISLAAHSLRWPRDAETVRSFTAEQLEESLLTAELKELDNGQTRRVSGLDPPFGACTPEMLDRARTNLAKHFALVGLTERFDETLALFNRELGWSIPGVYRSPRLVNPHRPVRTDLSAAAQDRLAELNVLDTQLYGFATELFDVAIRRHGEALSVDVAEVEATREAYSRDYGPSS